MPDFHAILRPPFVEPFNFGDSFGARVSIRSATVNFKTIAETNVFTVPTGFLFLPERMEAVTVAITTAGTAPTARWGNSGTPAAYVAATLLTGSNAQYKRHIFDDPQDAIAAGTILTAGITVASTASAHTGFFVYTGTLVSAT